MCLSYWMPSFPLKCKLHGGKNMKIFLILPSASSTVSHREVALSKGLLNKKWQRRVSRNFFLGDFLSRKWNHFKFLKLFHICNLILSSQQPIRWSAYNALLLHKSLLLALGEAHPSLPSPTIGISVLQPYVYGKNWRPMKTYGTLKPEYKQK